MVGLDTLGWAEHDGIGQGQWSEKKDICHNQITLMKVLYNHRLNDEKTDG